VALLAGLYDFFVLLIAVARYYGI